MPVADPPAFTRLDAQAGWRMSPTGAGVRIDPGSGAVELGFAVRQPSALVEPGGSFGGLTLPTGVAIGADGAVLVADPDARVVLHAPDPARGPDGQPRLGFAPLWPASTGGGGPYDLIRPVSLAFDRDGGLVLVDAGDDAVPARLIVYAWPAMAVRHVAAIGGAPGDVAVDARGRIHVADAAAGRVRRFDRLWREEDWLGGAGTLHRPRHLVIDAADTVFVHDDDPVRGGGRISRLTPLGAAVPLDDAALTGFWHGSYPPPLRIADGAVRLPPRSCADPGAVLANVAIDRHGRLPQGPSLLYRAQQVRRLRSGRFVSAAIDSDVFGFAWHQLRLDVRLGRADAVAIRTFTAATAIEPERIADLPDSRWSPRALLTPGMPAEAIVRSPPGRYLWIELTLIGDGTSSPAVDSIDILGPRRSSLRFLPAPFHEDPVSRDFLDRFLSYFDTAFAQVERTITGFPAKLTPQGAPEGAFLAWLAGWFDIAFLAEWPDATRRAFLAQAMDLHRTRGTIAGLQAVVRLHLGLRAPLPTIVEGFRLRDYATRRYMETGADLPGGVLRLGGTPLPAAFATGDVAHRFVLVVPEAAVPDADARATLSRLVDRFRPAHTAWTLVTAAAGIRVGCQSTIGVDTIVGTRGSEPLGAMRLGQSAVLPAPAHHLARVGDAVLRAPL